MKVNTSNKKDISFYKIQCSKNINLIFDELIKRGLIDQDSFFFKESKRRILNSILFLFYPVAEYIDNLLESNSEYYLQSSRLWASAYFLDQSLDSLENNPSTKVRAMQIYSYLLCNYFTWITESYSEMLPLFHSFYKRQTDYLILEKKWNSPELYIANYDSQKSIYKKAIFLIFPLELLNKVALIKQKYCVTTLKKIFVNYYSFVYLSDDIIDFQDDVRNKTLTFPISLFYKSKGKLPLSNEKIPLVSQCFKSLNNFQSNIKKCEQLIGKHSSIIEKKLLSLKQHLKKKAV